VLEVKGEIPFIIIVSVSVAGVLLLLLNIVLVSCFVQRRCSVSSRETTDGRSERVLCVLYSNAKESLFHREPSKTHCVVKFSAKESAAIVCLLEVIFFFFL